MALSTRLLVVLAAIGSVLLPVAAQSPTDTFIRIQDLRDNDGSRSPAVTRGSLSSRGGLIRSRAKASAPTTREARRTAIRQAYKQAARSVAVPVHELEGLKDSLAEASAELRSVKATILGEQKTDHGYTVEVEIAQTTNDLVAGLRATGLSNFRLVALLPETVDGARVTSPKVETALVGALASQRFRVYDWNFVAKEKPLASLISAILSGSDSAASQLGTRFLANLIIAGRVEAMLSQDNEGILSYVATATLRAIKADNGQILAAKEYSEKGFGIDRAQASRKALDALAQTVAKDLPAELLADMDQYPVTVQIKLKRPEQAGEVESFLRGLTGVTDVQQVQTPAGTAFRVLSHEKPACLGAQIGQSRDFRAIEYSRMGR